MRSTNHKYIKPNRTELIRKEPNTSHSWLGLYILYVYGFEMIQQFYNQ